MNIKKLLTFIIIVLITTISIIVFLNIKRTKNYKIGNNSNSQEIIDSILNINSYEAIIEVEVRSNKNINRYKIKQIYNGKDNNSQEILEPSNVSGIKIIKEDNNLKLENSNLNLTNLLQNYEHISDNMLDLNSFIDTYKNDINSKWEEKDNNIVMKNSNRILYINKNTGMPEKMEILNNDKKTAIYILYNEVKVNS